MGVYIKGMEMPTSGTYEVSIDNSYGKDKTVMSLFVRGDGGLICCGCYEIVPVPPHGRLIDADALASMYDPNADFGKSVRDTIRDCPTIIPADKEDV